MIPRSLRHRAAMIQHLTDEAQRNEPLTISTLYIDQQVVGCPEVAAVQSSLNVQGTVVSDASVVYRTVLAADDPIQKGKQVLFLTRNKGAFVRKCPGTRVYTCCGYMILHIGTFCSMDCAYCILQSYFHPPVLTYFVNRGDLSAELDRMFSEKTIRRIGTGEFTDSMIWESWSGLSAYLVPKFSAQSHTILELKTKTTAIASLKPLQHNGKTIVSWSLNTPRVIAGEERGTATLKARLDAASRCASWGYPLAFHFDPMLLYDGCEDAYRAVVEQLFARVPRERVTWISLGTFRFMPSLKPIIQKRFQTSKIVYGEFITGLDGKMRYFKPLRMDLYRKMVGWIREMAPDVLVYFCMEDDEVWEKCTGFLPESRGGLDRMLDQRAVKICGLTEDPVG